MGNKSKIKLHKTNKRKIGSEVEEVVCEFLKRKGFTILDRNWHYSNYGELDVVVREPKTNIIVFIEVRKTNPGYLHPSQILSQQKLYKLTQLCRLWLKSYGLKEFETDFRVDLITVSLDQKFKRIPLIGWLKSIL